MTRERDRFLLFEQYNFHCAWCGRQVGDEMHVHHQIHRGMGGRHGEAREESERSRIPLCYCCHAASHGERVIDSNGFECGYCDRECSHRMARIGTSRYEGQRQW